MIQPDRRVWAIGDVHGCFITLKKLISKINPRIVYLCGDLVNRGLDSKGVLDYAMKTPSVRPLMGNHEYIVIQAHHSPSSAIAQSWLEKSGGQEFLESFGVDHIRKVPLKYIAFMKTFPVVRRYGQVVLSHAGADMSLEKPFSKSEANRMWLMTNRKVKEPKDPNWTIVFGHTPTKMSKIRQGANTRKVCIDGGCCFGLNLVAYNIHTKEIVSVKESEY